MHIVTVIGIAIALAMDSLAVSIISGSTMGELKINNALRIALFFGVFQGLILAVGWVAGHSVLDLISGIGHWIAFLLLFFVGAKMIYESTKGKDGKKLDLSNIRILTILSVATSIDALAVGFSFAVVELPILVPAITVGVSTFLLSFLGVFVGNRIGQSFRDKAGIAGGIILIGIGVKILLEYLL